MGMSKIPVDQKNAGFAHLTPSEEFYVSPLHVHGADLWPIIHDLSVPFGCLRPLARKSLKWIAIAGAG